MGSFSCDICNVSYKSTSSLYNHKEFKHRGKRMQCKECDKKFTSYRGLKNHMNVIHSSAKPSFNNT